MPTYEYECSSCGKVFELFQSITEPPRKRLRKGDPKPCNCDAPVSRRISPGGGLIFKGSGFYITDYRSESYKNAAKAESGDSSTVKSADAAGDSKPLSEKSAGTKETTSQTASGAEKPTKRSKRR